MKFAIWVIFIALLIAFASAGKIPEEQYLPPAEEKEQIVAQQPLEESAALAEDGYRYKTVRKLRHRRDVSELFAQGTLADDGYHYHAPKSTVEPLPKLSQEYLPPVGVEEDTENKEVSEASKVSNEYLPPPVAAEEEKEIEKKEITAEVPEISREYLPPSTEAAATLDVPKFAASEELPSPSDDDAIIIEGLDGDESSVLADDGYHYRRIRYRRDVSEIVPSTGYSYETPVGDSEEIKSAYIPPAAEVKEAIAEPSVNEEIIMEYLPPVAEAEEAPKTAELADDGYRYKTVRKLKYRQRRDVSEILASTPVDQEESISEASVEYLPPVAEVKEATDIPSETAELAEDGYRYKTVRKLKYRQRRDVSEIVALESAILDKNGYHYRIPEPTQVISKVSNEYLPPPAKVREATDEPKEVKSTEAPVATEPTSLVAEVTTSTTEAVPEVTTTTTEAVPEVTTTTTEAVPIVTETTPTSTTESPSTTSVPAISNEYLPPAVEEVPLVKAVSEVLLTSTVAPVVSNQYLPPVEKVAEIKEASEIPEETAVLADDGYHYKVGKRFRIKRDVSELAAPSVEESAVFAEDGYHYKTPSTAAIPKVANEYLPPVEDDVTEVKNALNIVPTIAPEAVSNDYLPPSEATPKEASAISPSVVSNEYLPPTEDNKGDAEIIELPKESAVLADDGYRYKTVRRIRYRHRRDALELPNQQEAEGYTYNAPIDVEPQEIQYLPPVVAEVKETADTATLADDGYRYKTVRRIRYRHRV